MEENQKKAFKKAKQELSNKKWFRGVCMDNFPEEEFCKENFDEAVDLIILETAFWDDPDFFK